MLFSFASSVCTTFAALFRRRGRVLSWLAMALIATLVAAVPAKAQQWKLDSDVGEVSGDFQTGAFTLTMTYPYSYAPITYSGRSFASDQMVTFTWSVTEGTDDPGRTSFAYTTDGASNALARNGGGSGTASFILPANTALGFFMYGTRDALAVVSGITLSEAPPSIDYLSQDAGSRSGGDTVSIGGTRFAGDSTV